jgi:hypothetical protein
MIPWNHLDDAIVVVRTSRRVGIDEWQVLVAYTQNQMLWPHHIVVFIFCQSLVAIVGEAAGAAEIILIILRRVAFRF